MLYTRNAYLFRKYFKEKVARENGRLDLNFIGSLHPDKNRSENGFAKLIYGNREDLGKLLGSIALNVAADDQAIYELIQNADDSKSSFFSVNYNDKYLLCINNGMPFSDSDMSSIINVAANDKGGKDIGAFGIGFKILHRLVGIDDGKDAIIDDYAGPIIFSWNKFSQLDKFLKGDEIKIGFDPEKDKDNAWLVKILYTCFPSHLEENLKLKDYDTQGVEFKKSELMEMREFLNNSLQNVNLTETNNLKSGSIFFLKLGEGKSKFLNDGIVKIKSGLSYSFKFLNNLNKIYINEEEIHEQKIEYHSNSFLCESKEFLVISPKNKKREINYTFGFYKDFLKAENLRNEQIPNLYTFFSMDEEKNGLNFVLHCNAFDMNNDRRKLQANSQINERLLPIIANDIIKYIDKQKENNKTLFLSLYANLLLSKEPKSKTHVNDYFFKYLKEYLYKNIPTPKGFSDNAQNIKIKNTFLDINPADFGCPEINWFYWFNKSDDILIKEACESEKLNIKKWDIIDLLKYAIENGKVLFVDNWVTRAEKENYFTFLNEIDKHITKTSLSSISQIKLFKFSDQTFYSLNEIFESDDLILNYDKTTDIRFELQSIGFESSYINIEDYTNIKELINSKFDDLALFQQVANKIKVNQLRKEQKHKLFLALSLFKGVGKEKLRDLELFKDTNGNVCSLSKMIKGDLQVPSWLFSFKIHIAEYISELDKHLVGANEIYQEIILKNWECIISNVSDITEFYKNVITYYNSSECNIPLKKQSFVYVKEEGGFVSASEVFFNTKFTQITNYEYFQDSVSILTDAKMPFKDILLYLKDEPFKVENKDLLDYPLINNKKLSYQGIKAVLDFCKINKEHFFEKYSVEKRDNDYHILPKTEELYQVRPSSKGIKQFIENNMNDTFKILPFELDEYKDGVGIIQGENLYNLIIENVDIDDYKEQLIEVIAYEEPKRNFILGLSEIRFIAEENYTKDSFEYKILEIACEVIKEGNIQNFKNKVVIESDDNDLSLSEIPPFVDKIKIDGVELKLSGILPKNYENSNVLSNIFDRFIKMGLHKEKLDFLFGIETDPEPDQIFEFLSVDSKELLNGQQLAFLLLYNKITDTSIDKFKVNTFDDKFGEIRNSFYTQPIEFIYDDAILKKQYSEINELILLPFHLEDDIYLSEPYFTTNSFICPCIKDNLSDAEKECLLSFIYQKWNEEENKIKIKNIDWAKINNKETELILGFNPNTSVYPTQYACEEEQLPEYLIKWIKGDKQRILFLADLGVWVDDSIVVELRRFLIGQNDKFNCAKLSQELRFNNDETMLINTFNWLKENKYQLKTNEQFTVFEKIVDIINENRKTRSKAYLKIQVKYDLDLLSTESKEWNADYYVEWKEKLNKKFSIFLYNRGLPKMVGLDEIEDYTFYSSNDVDIILEDKYIYVNELVDIKKLLSSLIAEKNDFGADDLLELYQTKDNAQTENSQIDELKSEVERLRKRIADLEGVSGTSSYNATVSLDTEYHNEIKEKSEQYLYDILKSNFGNKSVKWLNFNELTNSFEESFQNHDFEILDSNNIVKHYIDCKGTIQQKQTFYLTSHEWEFFIDCVDKNINYQIYRVFDIESSPKHILIDDLWKWIEEGKVVPYLNATETIKGGRVFLTIT